ncbi:HAMP domain-containing histidine kinase [Actinotalea sp. M2MS4P-6]|uniref:sensor histidine kinase n=1 Tax=Actinotalea sp. M2MS4P-6 TaxID=2983762 RepID=UPI0021E3F4AD|nr:HAMP domain-containing sensor histidine kinase [Actinotalea sp. M2MS4P-6]MCV2394849.1 HAMP domain-containing histidine kinase [Actinotalea sp. M2MS4P-6]
MWSFPGEETMAYHLAWASFALLYGLGNWHLRTAVVGVAACTAMTGAVLVVRASTGVIAWQETSEIPLMALLVVLVVWHVRRRQIALGTVIAMADRERRLAGDRDRLSRLTSHELRTPLTIARGYVELLLNRPRDAEDRRDLEVVDDELDRLTRVTDRLVRAFRLQGGTDVEEVDLDGLVTQTAQRWSQVAERTWAVSAQAGTYLGSAERMRASLDTLIENALRYTGRGDRISLTASRRAGLIEVTVADSGSGLSRDQVAAINDPTPAQPPRDDLSQTGLGLALVRGLAEARGGRLVAATRPEGGSSLTIRFPVAPSAIVPRVTPVPERGTKAARRDEVLVDGRLRFEPYRRRRGAAPRWRLASTWWRA